MQHFLKVILMKKTALLAGSSFLALNILSVASANAHDGVAYDADISYQTLNYPGNASGTFFTGFRGDTLTGNYTIPNSANTGGILYSRSKGTWLNFPQNLPPVNLDGATTNTSYSANWGLYGNTLNAVGTYKKASYSSIYDLSYLYDATASSGSEITYLQVPANLKGDGDTSPTLFTFVHSVSGNFLVGNYDTNLATGNSFIYNIRNITSSASVPAGTYQAINIPNSSSTTTYGIYGHYISGGYAKVGDISDPRSIGLNHGFIAKINPDGTVATSTELNHPRALFTHFEGITGGGKAGRFNLVADYIDETGVHASYAHVIWDGVNDMTHINNSVEWFDYDIPGGTLTSANSGYQDMVVGIYQTEQTNAYLATIADVTEHGTTHAVYEPFAYNTGSIVTIAEGDAGVGIDATTMHPIYGNEYNDVINASTGAIITQGREAHGILSSEYGVVTNNGLIRVSGEKANAVQLHGEYSTLLNYGEIAGSYILQPQEEKNLHYTVLIKGRSILSQGDEAEDEEEYDLAETFQTMGNSVTNLSTGIISVTGEGGAAIANGGEQSLIDNEGTIIALGSTAHGILSRGDHTGIGNSGTITAIGSDSFGIRTVDGSTTINNSGSITASGENSTGIYLQSNRGHTNILNNSGTITGDAYGLRTGNTIAIAENTGIIQAATSAVSIESPDSSFTNSGSVLATASGGNAIQLLNDNGTVTLNPGSIITGGLSSAGSNNTLNINLGLNSAQSYAYTTSGDWNFSDADQGTRPAAAGGNIVGAAGITIAETSGQMLYQHNDAINQSLERYSLNQVSGNGKERLAWVDPYYSTITRSADSNPVMDKFRNYNYGFTAGFKLPVEAIRLDSILNVQASTIDAQDNSQSVSANSIMVGLAAPKLYEVLGADLSSKVLVGYTNHDGDRQVFVNSGTGTENVTADYDSYSVIFGSALTKHYKLNDTLSAHIIAGADIATEHYEAYAESAYFSWDSRDVTQLSSRFNAIIEKNLTNNKTVLFAGAGVANRWLLDGQNVSYQIDGTDVTFTGSKETDTYVTGQLGAKHIVSSNINMFATVNASKSANNISSVQAIVGGNISF